MTNQQKQELLDFLSNKKESIKSTASLIFEQKQKIKKLYSAMNPLIKQCQKKFNQQLCQQIKDFSYQISNEQSKLHFLRLDAGAENIFYSILKNYKNEKKRNLLINKNKEKLFKYLKTYQTFDRKSGKLILLQSNIEFDFSGESK